jgi:TetR/AcrR family transcriptional regulator
VAQGRRRDAILAAARSDFARYGFAGARIERIAAAADVNKQLIFHYFHSKEGLYSAVVTAIFASWQPAPDGAALPSERLRQVTAYLVQWLNDNPGAARALSEAGRIPGDAPAPPAEATRWLAGAMAAVCSAVEGGQRQGYFRDDADPQAIAQIVVGFAVGHAITVGPESGASPADSLRLVANLSRAMVEYCSWR